MKKISNLSLRQEVDKYKREIEKIPDPSFGRIQELREKIKKKTLLTKEALEETAEHLTRRFLGKD
ncbi:MAG: hypothetical protein HY584_03040 [Candidatus Omnitrophica bacterium]|nr:hypothetical protein [Candidatus Omnitrophota bacterium]